jgi:hypothetical protein
MASRRFAHHEQKRSQSILAARQERQRIIHDNESTAANGFDDSNGNGHNRYAATSSSTSRSPMRPFTAAPPSSAQSAR